MVANLGKGVYTNEFVASIVQLRHHSLVGIFKKALIEVGNDRKMGNGEVF